MMKQEQQVGEAVAETQAQLAFIYKVRKDYDQQSS
jgi:hypothetical protein